jgi:hypothetical protein
MNRFVLCFSADVAALRNNQLFNEEVSAKFPGAKWVFHLMKLSKWPVDYLTADVTLQKVRSKLIDARNVLILQHNIDSECDELVMAGAKLLVIIMFESPLYSPNFYQSIASTAVRCNWLLSFEGLSAGAPNNLHAYFPSFSISDLNLSAHSVPWRDREYACMVVANKYVLTNALNFDSSWEYKIWWLLKALRQWLSGNPNSRDTSYAHFQLQDQRLEVIEEMLRREKLDLYGEGWDKLYRVPPEIRKRITPLIKKTISTVSNKRACLSKYKFNICFENFAAPSYITEKIFDAMLAGTVPVYLGAQDIKDYVPADCFIDASGFDSIGQLADYLDSISELEAANIIDAGQFFMKSDAGLKYSYEAMACRIAQKIDQFFHDEIG